MGKQRRKFKQQIVQEVESGLLSVSAASRKYQISGSVIDGWRRKARQGGFGAAASVREKLLERELKELPGSSRTGRARDRDHEESGRQGPDHLRQRFNRCATHATRFDRRVSVRRLPIFLASGRPLSNLSKNSPLDHDENDFFVTR